MKLQSVILSLSDEGDRRDLTQGWEGRIKGVVGKHTWARMDPEFWTVFIIISGFFFFCNHRNKPKAMLLCWMFSVLGAALCVEDCAICCVSGLKVKSYNFL